jgi:hypothetical protein
MYEALATTLSARDNYATEFPERNFAEVAKGGDALSRLVLEVFAGYRQYFDGLKQLEESTTMPVDVHEYVSVSVCVCVCLSVFVCVCLCVCVSVCLCVCESQFNLGATRVLCLATAHPEKR